MYSHVSPLPLLCDPFPYPIDFCLIRSNSARHGQAQKIATEGGGGDWDRRNRLKVYRGLQRMIERNITESASLMLDCIATFSCNEVCTYQEFIVYAIMTNLLKLARPVLKAKILDGPEVLSVANDIPEVVSSLTKIKHR